LFQFILIRWYFRLFIWARFLWQVSRLELKLLPTHPDRCGGLGFLTVVPVAFAPVILAQGALLAGTIANQIFFTGAKLRHFTLEITSVVVVMLLTVVGPLLVFIPVLGHSRRLGLREYGTLAQRYVREFDQKWLRGGAPAGEQLIGNADIQSLADLSNSYNVAQSMSLAPISKETIISLAVLALLPLVPLLFTVISLEELIQGLLKVVF
jgi:hypothetical protein